MKVIIALILIVFAATSYAQSDKEKARDLAMEAIQKMEAGNTKEAEQLLEKSKKLDPDNIDYPYEIAYCHYLDKNYSGAIKILEKLVKHEDVNDRIYQMIGNCHDLNKNPDEAIKSYEAGLKLFPNSGILYLERGNMELIKEDYGKALMYYESGIAVRPSFPSNYYWAAKIYLSSTEEVWGLIYGEMFMNLERNSRRTQEISKIIFDTYKSQITLQSDSTMSVSFCKQMTMTVDDLEKGEDIKLPFCMVYEPTLLMSIISVKEINLASLDAVRTRFINSYYDSENDKTYPNVLFDFHKELIEKGHFEAYNHWVLMMGAEDEFTEWNKANANKWDRFVAWFTENPMTIDEAHKFHSGQY